MAKRAWEDTSFSADIPRGVKADSSGYFRLELSGYRTEDHSHASHAKVWLWDQNNPPDEQASPGDIWLHGTAVKIMNKERIWKLVS